MSRAMKLLSVACAGGVVALALVRMPQVTWTSEVLHAAQEDGGPILSGSVKSASGERMAGVTVSARVPGQSLTTSVFTDDQGRYFFPPMESGRYRVWAQAAGWVKGQRDVDLKGTSSRQDFTLNGTKDFWAQLSGDQMVAVLPEDTAGHRRMKAIFIGVCTECHAANVALHNRFDEKGWDAIVEAMSRTGFMNSFGTRKDPVMTHFRKELTAYLAEMRGPGPSPLSMKAPARPTGDAALPVVYEYDLPFENGGGYLPNNGSDWSLGNPAASGGGFGLHDATADFNGNLWFTYNTDSVDRSFGKIDGKTGKVTDFVAGRKPDGKRATNTHGILTGADGMIWFNVNLRSDLPGNERTARLDPKTEKYELFIPPAGVRGHNIHVAEDGRGNIWGSTETGAALLDPKTGQFTNFKSLTLPGSTYGAAGDRDGNGWWTQIGIDIIGHADVKTGQVSEIKLPPPSPLFPFLKAGDLSAEEEKVYFQHRRGFQGPRRPAADAKSPDVWIPNWSGNNLLRINIDTLKTTFYPAPGIGMNPYMSAIDNSHQVWVSMQGGDQVGKFDPKTETWTMYSWPSRGTGLRNMGLADHNGVVQVVGAYNSSARVGRMVMRSREDLQALRRRVGTTLAQAR